MREQKDNPQLFISFALPLCSEKVEGCTGKKKIIYGTYPHKCIIINKTFPTHLSGEQSSLGATDSRRKDSYQTRSGRALSRAGGFKMLFFFFFCLDLFHLSGSWPKRGSQACSYRSQCVAKKICTIPFYCDRCAVCWVSVLCVWQLVCPKQISFGRNKRNLEAWISWKVVDKIVKHKHFKD